MSGEARKIVFGQAASALFDLHGPTAVSAGAGTGKTTALVELCVRLLSGEATAEPCDPGAIAVVTFTEKAAEELVLRLRAAVAERARAALAAAPGSPGAAAWVERLHGLDRMAVGTIHGFCGRLLRDHAPEAGLDPEFAVVDEERAGAWLSDAARGAVVAALDAERPAARTLAAGLGAGGAGRGGLASVVADLVRARATRGARGLLVPAPAREEEAREARRRLRAAAGAIVRGAAAAAGNGARALGEDVARALAALPPDDAAAIDDLPAIGALAGAARGKRLGKDDGALREAKDALVAAAREAAALEAERLAGPQKDALAALVADAEARYTARKRDARAVDFDDLLALARDLLARDGPSSGPSALRAELRARFRALLVDEYQDVNGLQQELFEALAGPGETAGPVLVAVGDLKQSIYRFRGADVSVFARVVRAMSAGAGRVLHLSENHRSAPALLDLVNETFARCMRPPAGVAPRDDELAFGDEDRLVPTRAEGARPACEILEDPAAGTAAERRLREADAIARRIGAIVAGAAGVAVRSRGPGGEELARRPSWQDVAVLFRRLTQIGPYERALRAAGIPYRLARGGGFYQAPEVRDAGELLATLFDPGDATAWAAVLRSPLCLVSDATLLLLARRDGGPVLRSGGGGGLPRLARSDPDAVRRELREAAPLPADEGDRLVRFLRAWHDLRAVRDRLPLPELLGRAVEALDLDAALLAAPDGERRAVNLEKVLAIAARFEADGGRGADLARHLRALAARPPREPEAELEAGDAVALLSVHQAKGLEWPVVFVPDLGARARSDAARALVDPDGRLCLALADPARDAFVETAGLRAAREADRRAAAAESRRLLYVALTRARDHLVLSGEAGNGREDATWRGLVEAAAAARPELVRRVPLAEAGTAAAGPALPGPERAAAPVRAPLAAPRLAPPAPVAAIRVAVTDLAEYARCPRRHHLGRFLGLPEPRGAAAAPADDPGRATVRGTLAHAMLAETDLAAPPLERRAQLAAAAARRGHDPASAGVRRILAEVARFADSVAGRALAAAAREGRLARELPFLLRLEGDGVPDAYLVGAIDALVAGERGQGITVVDYKYATARPGAADRYRLQLVAYALAARRAHPGARVGARVQFLRGDLRAVDLTPSEADLAAFAREAPRLAWEAHRGAGDRPPAELGRDEARCRADGCGFVSRCFPGARAASRPGARAGEGVSACLARREVSTLRPVPAGPT
ncbi:MAG TPA: UvrD-helicase domain-containing protein [Anaeromyxobacter sp.]|nr:UvrD-helicase domain-containing protein [Anaeromyxobacter sp.]